MCQPFSFKAVVTAPRSLSGVAGDRGWGAVLPARAAAPATRRLRDSRDHSAVGFGSDSPTCLCITVRVR